MPDETIPPLPKPTDANERIVTFAVLLGRASLEHVDLCGGEGLTPTQLRDLKFEHACVLKSLSDALLRQLHATDEERQAVDQVADWIQRQLRSELAREKELHS